MTELERDWENDAEWSKWKQDLQSEVPGDAILAMRSAMRDFHTLNHSRPLPQSFDLDMSISECAAIEKPRGILERVPRWLGYAGAAIAVLAACVITFLFPKSVDHQPLGIIRPYEESILLAQQRPQAFPSMMVSLTGPGNSIQSFARIRNPGFEQIEYRSDQSTSQPVPGWTFPIRCRDAGYRIEVDTIERFDGSRCAMIECTVEQPGLIGNLMQTLDATIYRNKTVRLSAALRADVPDNGSQVQMWLRIDNEDLSIGFFDRTEDRPVRTSDWQYTEIVTRVSQNAQYINLGAFLMGNGTAWLDDFQLEIID